MPDDRLEPEWPIRLSDAISTEHWRAPHVSAAEQLKRAHIHAFTHYDALRMADVCQCGARRDRLWNTIEGGDH